MSIPLLIIEADGTTDPYRLIETLTLTVALREVVGPILQVIVVNESRWGETRAYRRQAHRTRSGPHRQRHSHRSRRFCDRLAETTAAR